VSEYFSQKPAAGRYWPELQHRFQVEIVPALGSYKLIRDITKKDIRALLEAKRRIYPAAARTMYDGLRPFFKWCISYDYLSVSPLEGLFPPPAPASRDRILSPLEIISIWRATDDDNVFSPFFRLLLLTGQRRQEVSGMASNEINDQLWIIPSCRTKTKTPSVVSLSTLASIEIQRCRYIDRGLSGFSKAKARLDRLSGVSNWRIHDLRRTCASYMAMQAVPEHIIERVLNHRIPGVRGIYNRYSYIQEKAEGLQKLSNYIFNLTTM